MLPGCWGRGQVKKHSPARDPKARMVSSVFIGSRQGPCGSQLWTLHRGWAVCEDLPLWQLAPPGTGRREEKQSKIWARGGRGTKVPSWVLRNSRAWVRSKGGSFLGCRRSSSRRACLSGLVTDSSQGPWWCISVLRR